MSRKYVNGCNETESECYAHGLAIEEVEGGGSQTSQPEEGSGDILYIVYGLSFENRLRPAGKGRTGLYGDSGVRCGKTFAKKLKNVKVLYVRLIGFCRGFVAGTGFSQI